MTNTIEGNHTELLSTKEASMRLGIGRDTLLRWIRQRRIEYVKIGRLTKISTGAIEQYIRDHTMEARRRPAV